MFEELFGTQLSDEVEAFGDLLVQYGNPNLSAQPTKSWFMGSFGDAIFVAGAYLLFVIVVSSIFKAIFGSKEVEKPADKKPTSVWKKIRDEPVLIIALIYNPVQVILCGYMMTAAFLEARAKNYSFICNAFNAEETGMAAVLWIFYLSKILDFVDTLIIIVRRKWRQLSFLHVYHHISIFLVYWLNLRGGYDGDIYYTIILNSFVHLVMYSYYQATTLEIQVPKTIKKMITKMQQLQFVSMNVQAIYMIYFKCPYPQPITWFYLFYIISLFLLFENFSRNTYAEAKGAKDAKDAKSAAKDGKSTDKKGKVQKLE